MERSGGVRLDTYIGGGSGSDDGGGSVGGAEEPKQVAGVGHLVYVCVNTSEKRIGEWENGCLLTLEKVELNGAGWVVCDFEEDLWRWMRRNRRVCGTGKRTETVVGESSARAGLDDEVDEDEDEEDPGEEDEDSGGLREALV